MARSITYRPNRQGMKEVLISEEVKDDLVRRARNVAAEVRRTAPGVFSRAPGGIIADGYTGRGRAGATVIGVPLAYEQKHRALGGAIDAAAE